MPSRHIPPGVPLTHRRRALSHYLRRPAGAQRLAQFQEYMHGRGLGAAPGSASRAEQPVCAPPGSGKKAKQRRRASTGSAGPGTFSRPRASEFF